MYRINAVHCRTSISARMDCFSWDLEVGILTFKMSTRKTIPPGLSWWKAVHIDMTPKWGHTVPETPKGLAISMFFCRWAAATSSGGGSVMGIMGTGCFLRRSKCLQGAEMCRIIYVLFLRSKNASAQVRKKQVGWPQFQTQPLQCSSSETRDHAGPSSAGPRALPRLKLPRNEAPGPPSCPGSQCFSQPSMAPWRLPGLTTKAVGAKGCALLLSPRGKLLVELAGAWWREVQYPWGNPLSPFFRGIWQGFPDKWSAENTCGKARSDSDPLMLVSRRLWYGHRKLWEGVARHCFNQQSQDQVGDTHTSPDLTAMVGYWFLHCLKLQKRRKFIWEYLTLTSLSVFSHVAEGIGHVWVTSLQNLTLGMGMGLRTPPAKAGGRMMGSPSWPSYFSENSTCLFPK